MNEGTAIPTDDQIRLLQDLTQAPGAPGHEGPVRDLLRRHLAPHAEVSADGLGSLIARRRGTADEPRVMVAGHLDEVGFMVTRVSDEGFLSFQTLGGWWEQVMLAQRVRIPTRRGDVEGVVGSKPPHVLPPDERKKPVERKDMFIDVGARDRAEVERLGVRPGDPVVPVCPFTRLGEHRAMAKAFDNRAGCGVLVEVLRLLAAGSHPNALYAVATVQEEVGLRGAQTSAQQIQPQVGIAVDVAVAGDTPHMKPEEASAKLGAGPVLLLYDGSLVPNPALRQLVADTAGAEGIPLQHDLMAGGGTDAGRIQLAGPGVPSVVIGIPARYIHSAASVIDLRDYINAARLVAAVVVRLDAAAVSALRT